MVCMLMSMVMVNMEEMVDKGMDMVLMMIWMVIITEIIRMVETV